MLALWNRLASRKEGPRRHKIFRGEILEERLALSAVPPTVVNVELGSSEWTTAFYDHLQSEELGDNGYQIPVGTSAQNTTLPWNNLDKLRITFSENVLIDQADLSLTSAQQAAFEVIDFDFDSNTNVAEWTFSSALPNDRFQIDLDTDGADPIRDVHGNLLDGEWGNGLSSYPSGDGIAGGDFEFAFNVFAGDAFGIEILENNNLWSIYLSVGQGVNDPHYLARRDINGNGIIDTPDWQQVWFNMWDTLPAGTPIGATDDAPTTSGFDLVSINSYSIDSVIQLDTGFSDHGSNASALTYSIKEIDDPLLFDSAYIDHATGELILNAAAPTPPPPGISYSSVGDRTSITLSAKDASGQEVETEILVDINRNNIPPTIINVTTTQGIGNGWIIEGYVTDPDNDLDPLYVAYLGSDGVNGIATVAQDGYFSFATVIDPNQVESYDLLVDDFSGGYDLVIDVYVGV